MSCPAGGKKISCLQIGAAFTVCFPMRIFILTLPGYTLPIPRFDSLEDALSVYPGTPMEKLCAFLEVSAKSPQKKLNMFLALDDSSGFGGRFGDLGKF